MAYKLSKRSIERLIGVHPSLVSVVHLAIRITPVDFTVLEGVRTVERQRALVANGSSWTMDSRHIPTGEKPVGHAVDLGAWVDGEVSWHGPLYHRISEAMKEAADQLGIPIEWGGDWRSVFDGPHFQLPLNQYPKG